MSVAERKSILVDELQEALHEDWKIVGMELVDGVSHVIVEREQTVKS